MTRMRFTSVYNFDSANRILSTRDLDQILDIETDMGRAFAEAIGFYIEDGLQAAASSYLITAAAMAADPQGALEAAVTALQAVRGGRIQLPRGTYTLTNTITLLGASQWDDWGTGGIEIIGAGLRGTRLIGPSGKAAFNVGSTTGKLAFTFRDLTISGPGKANAGSIGIDSRSTGGSYVFDNVLISDFKIGIRYFDNTLVDASHLNIRKCGTGLAMGYYSDVHQYAACRFDSCDTAVHIGYWDTARSQSSPTESHATSFTNCIMNTNGVCVYIDGSSHASLTFDTCYMEQYDDIAMRIGIADGSRSVGAPVIIDNCFFNGNRLVSPAGKRDHAIEVNNGQGVDIRGGNFRSHLVTPINVTHVSARVRVGGGSYNTVSGELGTVKLPDASYVTVGTDRPVTVGRLSQKFTNFAASVPTATVDYLGAQLRVAGVTYECGSDGVGGYAWYAQPTAKRGTELISGSFYPSVFVGAGSLEISDGAPTRNKVFTRWLAWRCADATDDGVGTAFKVPADWTTANYDILWSRSAAGSGDVTWVLQIATAAAGVDLTSSAYSNDPTVAVPNVNELKVTRTITGAAVVPGSLHSLRCYRSGNDIDDTFADNVELLGILITKAS